MGLQRVRFPFDGIALGCDYNPEQWPRETWREDVALMREAGVGFVTLGVFSWALLQPTPDTWDFGWFDEIVELLHEGGIAIDMATATAAPPPWLTTAHPEILTVDREGHTLWPGSRQSWCPSSPVFLSHALALVEQMATRYGDHPAVRLWHVSNELGCHNGRCWCDTSAAAFRSWLVARYGEVDALNEAWGTAFWSQHYSSFEEVLPPRITPAVPNPAHELDFARFSSDALLDYHRAERDVIRRHSERPVTTNFMVASHQSEQDYFAWAPEQDVVSQDHYLDHRMPDIHAEQAFTDDLTRGVAGGSWLLMESATSAVNWQPVNVAKKPGELLVDSLRHVARGADAVGFFQWRASRAGGEKFHSALVPHAGPDSARFREVVGLGAALRRIADVAGEPVEADVALLFDWNAWWACDLSSHPSAGLHYIDAVHRWHAAVTDLGATADVVHPSSDLSGYKVVIVATLYLCDDAVAPALQGVVDRGGHVLVTYFSGIVDPSDHIRLGGYPGAFRELLGVRSEEFAPLPSGVTVTLDDGSGADLWSEVLTTRGAEVVASYVDGPLPGTAAVTRQGGAWYVATRLDAAATSALADRITREAGVRRLDERRPGVEVVRRGRHLFVLNRSDTEVTVPGSGRDLLTGTDHHGKVTVASGSAVVVRDGGALMLARQRQELILGVVRTYGGVRVSDLVERLGVSDMTVRRDIEALAGHGLVTRVHGGATAAGSSVDEPGFAAKSTLHTAAKRAIATAAAALVEPGASVALSAGTTTHAVASALLGVPRLTVVTNSLRVAEVLYESGRDDLTVVLTGGERTPSDALVGPVAVAALRRLHVDWLLMGVHGMDAEAGFTTPNLVEAETNRALVRSARRVAVVADNSKWGVVGLSTIATLDEVDVVVSDRELDPDARRLLESSCGKVVLAA